MRDGSHCPAPQYAGHWRGRIGWAARRACLRRGLPFTTGFHTRFAEYAAARIPLPGVARLGWAILRRFHAPSRGVMVPTPSMGRDLAARGFRNIRTWTRGVNHTLFQSYDRDFLGLPRPILLYAGRLAVEKGIEDFLNLDVGGTKLLVGDGPERQDLAQRYPSAVFLGYRHDADYARTLAAADVLVFSSRTDTFGLVMLEAMACGTPIAAFDVTGPIDVVTEGVTGSLGPDLAEAVRRALKLDRRLVQEGAAAFTWERTADMFESWLQPITRPVPPTSEIRAGKEVHLR
jgi:glycosyltransferase involved in cell wall biosynthesis